MPEFDWDWGPGGKPDYDHRYQPADPGLERIHSLEQQRIASAELRRKEEEAKNTQGKRKPQKRRQK